MGFRDRGWDERDGERGERPDLDLDELACPTCRRELHPWESECPDCREPAVLRYSLAPTMPPVPAHLREDPRVLARGGPDDASSDPAATLIDQAFPVTEQETREPLDDDLPEPPPVGGDPHFD